MTAWIKAGVTTCSVSFEAPPGLSAGWSVWYAKAGGTGTPAQMTTPTVAAVDATNIPTRYSLAIDEAAMVTMTADTSCEEVVLYVKATGWQGASFTYNVFNYLPADLIRIVGSNDLQVGGTGGQAYGIS